MALDFIYTSQGGFQVIGSPEKIHGQNYVSKALGYPRDIERKYGESSPIMFVHTTWNRKMSIISQIVPRGNDNAGRPGNFLAHHLVLDNEEIAISRAGPAWLLENRPFVDRWETSKAQVYQKSFVEENDYGKRIDPPTWKKFFGDAWREKLGYWIEALLEEDMKRRCVFYFKPERHPSETILALYSEALSWLDEPLRWKVPFSTFATDTHKELNLLWMGIIVDDERTKRLFVAKNSVVITLP